MNILIVAKRHYTGRDLLSDRYGRLYHFPRVVAEMGHSVVVVALDYKTFKHEVVEEGRLRLISLPSRSGGFVLPSRRLGRLFANGWFPDRILGSGHLHIAWRCLEFARTRKIPFIMEAYDYYPAFLPKVMQPIGSAVFKHLAHKSSACIAASEALFSLMSTFNKRVLLLENGFDPRVMTKHNKEVARRALKIPNDCPCLCFIGSARQSLGFGDFLESMKSVRRHFPAVKVLHAGYLDPVFKNSEGFTSLGFIPQEQVAIILSACDCGVVPYRESLQVQYSNSCKLIEYMACSLPIVATRCGDALRLLGEDYPGLAHPSQPESLAEAILRQLRRPVPPPDPDSWRWQRLGERLVSFLESSPFSVPQDIGHRPIL